MGEYLTDTQLEGIGQTLANIACEFAYDDNYIEDVNTTIVYDGKVTPAATRENYRLPTIVSTTLGADQSSRNVSWYTKTSVKGTDIEIIPYSENPVFTGKSMVPYGVKVNVKTERTERQYPGVDLGVIGIMNYKFPMNRHIVEVSGLEAGKEYYYRVGDASRNWWSDIGTFKMADGSDETSFIHICDPQSQSEQQYETFSKVIETAYDMYDSDFIINTGDNVDHGDNFRQWQWLFNTASETLMDTTMMSASGNHEGMGSYAIEKNYYYSNVPEQDTESGIYFSFDYNNVHVAVLNTNNLNDDKSLSDAQVDWLIDDMQSSDADWKFVAMHKAIYSNGSHYKDKDVCKIRDELCKLMPQLGIDMVFQGHDHVYLRTDAMIDNKVESVTTSTAEFNGKKFSVAGMAKGAGMIEPNMATMLAFIVSDAAVEQKLLKKLLKECADKTFNRMTVDGDMSTNDTVLCLCNGAGGVEVSESNPEALAAFKAALLEVSRALARKIVGDGEKITKVVEVKVKGARDSAQAEKICRAIGNSLLVKSSWFGEDPNWGRLTDAAGYARTGLEYYKIDLDYDGVAVLVKGQPIAENKPLWKKIVSQKTFTINMNLNLGDAEESILAADLTEGYVNFNKGE